MTDRYIFCNDCIHKDVCQFKEEYTEHAISLSAVFWLLCKNFDDGETNDRIIDDAL